MKVLAIIIFTFSWSQGISQKFTLTHKDGQPLGVDTLQFEVSKTQIRFGSVNFTIANKSTTFSDQRKPVYVYVTGTYPEIKNDTMIWSVSESEMKGVWIIAIGNPKQDHRNPDLMRSRTTYLGKMKK